MTGHPRIFADVPSRDQYIDGQPARGHVAKFTVSTHAFRCVKCGAKVDDCGLFCALHLWTLDNPVLRDARIFQ